MRRWIFRTWSMALTAAAVGSAAAANVLAATPGSVARPPATAPAAGAPAEAGQGLKQIYSNVSADALLNEIAEEFDLVILKPEALNARISVRMPKDADADDAIAAVKNALIPQGFSLQSGDAVCHIWQVVPATREDVEALAAARRAGEAKEAKGDANTMMFRFVDTPVEKILEEMSRNLGIEIDRAGPVPGRISVYVPNPVDAAEAVRLLNALLASSGYTAMVIDRYNPDGTPRLAVRVWTIDEAKKGAIPVD
jgi:hypothetical protein